MCSRAHHPIRSGFRARVHQDAARAKPLVIRAQQAANSALRASDRRGLTVAPSFLAAREGPWGPFPEPSGIFLMDTCPNHKMGYVSRKNPKRAPPNPVRPSGRSSERPRKTARIRRRLHGPLRMLSGIALPAIRFLLPPSVSAVWRGIKARGPARGPDRIGRWVRKQLSYSSRKTARTSATCSRSAAMTAVSPGYRRVNSPTTSTSSFEETATIRLFSGISTS